MELDKNELCTKCGYVRHDDDEGPDYACPKCGATYDKVAALFGDLRPPVKPVKSDEKKTVQSDGKKTENCPYCGEEILAVAIKCKHCGSDLEREPRESQQQAKRKTGVDQTGRNTVIGLTVFFLILLLILGKMNPLTGWAVLIGPFDSRPNISLLDALNPGYSATINLSGW